MTQEKANILVVDDRPDGLLAMQALLSSPDLNVITSSSGKEALTLLKDGDFAVILLDVQMPDMDGFETARQIKQTERIQDIPILFITAINKQIGHIMKGYASGAIDYLFKPIDPDIMRSKVAVFVELFRKNQKLREQALLLLETERHEKALEIKELELENRRRYQNLADAIPHMVWKIRTDGTADYFNQYWSDYTGLTQEQSSGAQWQSVVHPLDLKIFFEKWEKAKKQNQNFEAECRFRRRSNAMYRLHLVRAVQDHHQLPLGTADWIFTSTDIHDRKKAEQELIEAREKLELRVEERTIELSLANQQLRMEITERIKAQEGLIEISDREQRRIGQDLHDGVAQQLAAISFMSKILQQKLTVKKAPEAEDASQILNHIQKAIVETKRLARGYYPIELERHGLFPALRELAQTTASLYHIPCACDIDYTIEIQDEASSEHLFRITQEAVHNAVQHAKPQHIQITVKREQNVLCLQIHDDGIGIRAGQTLQGMGLRTMNYRSNMIGASLSIEPHSVKGTLVQCKIPIEDWVKSIITVPSS